MARVSESSVLGKLVFRGCAIVIISLFSETFLAEVVIGLGEGLPIGSGTVVPATKGPPALVFGCFRYGWYMSHVALLIEDPPVGRKALKFCTDDRLQVLVVGVWSWILWVTQSSGQRCFLDIAFHGIRSPSSDELDGFEGIPHPG